LVSIFLFGLEHLFVPACKIMVPPRGAAVKEARSPGGMLG
jgi:hypothetical protein